MVDASGYTAPASPKEPVVDLFYIDGGYSQISISTSQGAHHQCFLALMVGASRSTAMTPPRELVVNVS
jgi:hypothetical protein